MIPLRAFGRDLQKVHLRREAGLVRDTKSILDRMRRDMTATADEWLDAMVINGQLNYKLWDRWQRSFVNALHRNIKDAYDDLAGLTITAQKTAFDTASSAIVAEFKTLYPMIKVEKTDKEPKPLTFIDKSLEALHAECCAELMESGIGQEQAEAQSWASVTAWSSIEEARIPVLQVGKGRVTPEYLQFLRDQTRSDIAPGNLIKTISADQLKVVQGTLVSAMEKGKDMRWTKDKIMSELGKGMIDEKAKEKLDYNVMRIVRTSHNRAANASIAYFSAQNPVVAEMERVADGRPCAACITGDTKIITKDGRKPITDVQIGDEVLTHKGRFMPVLQTMSRGYCGVMVLIHARGRSLRMTPEHEILTEYGFVPAMTLKHSDGIVVWDDKAKEMFYCRPDWFTLYEDEPWEEMVYNLEVAEDNSYVANGICVHNCLILDGTRYAKGQVLVDHPNGMCLLTPVVKSLEEMGYDYNSLPETAKKAWVRQERPHPPMKIEFYELPEKDQRIVLGNSTFELWKKEKFPLEALVVRSKGWLTPITFKDLQAKISTLGGLSAPKASLTLADGTMRILTAADRAITLPLDPVDRANPDAVIWQGQPPRVSGQYQQDLFGMGVDGMIPESVRAQAEDWLFSVGKLPDDATWRAQAIAGAKWQEFNEYARTLGLYARKGTDGRFYYVVPKGKEFNAAMRLTKKAS